MEIDELRKPLDTFSVSNFSVRERRLLLTLPKHAQIASLLTFPRVFYYATLMNFKLSICSFVLLDKKVRFSLLLGGEGNHGQR